MLSGKGFALARGIQQLLEASWGAFRDSPVTCRHWQLCVGGVCRSSHRNSLLPTGWAEMSSLANAPQKERSCQSGPHPVRMHLHPPHDGMLQLQPGPTKARKPSLSHENKM